MERNVLILTMSSKYHGYCVAGIDIDNGKWVRLVSNDKKSHGALSRRDIIYENKTKCKPLDVVKVPIIKDMPLKYQPENVLINCGTFWKKIETIDINELIEYHEPEKHDFIFGGTCPYIKEWELQYVEHSLVLVEVDNLNIYHPSYRKTKAKFTYNGNKYYNISVTDPEYYDSKTYKFKKAILVVSLPNIPFPHDNNYYKFIAKIFPM
ncbi:Uncharacterised protein [[Eubacterium] infirmum]|nr:Uncharacterised protein [[Eubacterium] infirmum]